MKPTQVITEADKYLLYSIDMLQGLTSQFNVDREDKIILEKYSEDLYAYYKALEQLKDKLVIKEKNKREELEEIQEK